MLNDCYKEMLLMPRYSEQFSLPVGYGVTNNPWFELAVAQKILDQNDGPVLDFTNFSYACILKDRSPMRGRWPGNRGGNISHDELIGRAYISDFLARDDREVLNKNLGFYRNDKEYALLKTWMFRFPWAMAFIDHRAVGDTSKLRRYIWKWHTELITEYPATEGTAHILTWLMVDEMKRYEICKEAATEWQARVSINNVMRNYFGNGSWHAKWAK